MLLELLVQRNEIKADAAVFGLVQLGGEDVIDQLKAMLPETEGLARFRVVKVLHALGDPLGEKLMREEMMALPTLEQEVAIILAPEGDVRAMQALRERLSRRFEPVEETLLLRADAAAALIRANDPTMLATLMDLRRSDIKSVQIKVYELLGMLGNRSLLPVAQPGLEEKDPEVALKACESVLALVDIEFRGRLLATLH
jgi:HEAT repeat protein